MTRQPEGYVDDVPVSGRDRPRPTLTIARHNLRFRGAIAGGVIAYCAPCTWRTTLEDGHDLPDFINLLAQHGGLEAAKDLCIETLPRYGSEHDEPRPLGVAQCAACHATDTELIQVNVLVDGVEQPGASYCKAMIECAGRVDARAQVKM